MQYKIGGCDVFFPHQAYGVQLSFMSKVITALEHGDNALLEAPTGSGKTLSLLCSSLAWQQREKLRIEDGLAAETAAKQAGLAGIEQAHSGQYVSPMKPPGSEGKQGNGVSPGQAGDGGFMPEQGEAEEPGAVPARKKPPKIFYATRTHSQIAQVVRELKRSNYHPKMAILASRKQYCINKFALGKPSVDEACEDLRQDGQCKYHKNFMSLVTSGFAQRVHDIEDLCNYGRTNKACPYFASRKMAEEAELIFGPYSYLLDPVIRRAMQIDVTGSMLIFDEAHNIEDVCRESASCEVDMTTMIEVAGSFNKALACNNKPEIYGPLTEACSRVLGWMQHKENEAVAELARQRRPRTPTRQDPYEKVFMAQPLLDQLSAAGLGPDKVDSLWECYQMAREEDEALAAGKPGAALAAEGNENTGANGEKQQDASASMSIRVGALALGVLSRLVHTVRMLHQVSADGSRDYRLVVQRFEDNLGVPRFQGRSVKRGDDDDGGARADGIVFNLCLWCLNPAVIFKDVSEAAHSIILTSGTLAPLDSFASELGAPFKIKLEAPHVVDMRKQVWAGIVTTGPGGERLEGSYVNAKEEAYQDGVGRTVLECCNTIPDGVLLFLPSYAAMDKLSKRWKATGVWGRLGKLKNIVSEPRGGGNEALQKVMEQYYGAIRRGEGGLFMAVCRGKVSEGLDFADRNARGVIIVGIPFPSVKDTKVNEKKAFNNRGRKDGLLSGDAWYLQQAFRALNQAVGRCIRHRYDWGAIVLVDERFKTARNQEGLSRWVRGALVVHPTFESASSSMQSFFQTIQANPPQRPQQPPHAATADADLAAAAAAAVAMGLPPPTQAAGVPGGQVITQAVGRGAEGALGHWTTQQPPGGSTPGFEMHTSGAPGGAGGAGLYGMWQGKPLAQARMEPPAGAAGQPPAAAQPPVTTQRAPPAAQPQRQQPQRLVTAEAVAMLVQQAPLAEWVEQDVQMYMAYLAEKGVNPEQIGGASSMLDLAMAAVTDSFEAAREFLGAGQPLRHLAAEWQSSLPRGLQALVASTGAVLPSHVVMDRSAVVFGQQCLRGYPMPVLLDAMSSAYTQLLERRGSAKPSGATVPSVAPGGIAAQHAGQQGDTADASSYAALATQPYHEWAAQQQQQQHAPPGPASATQQLAFAATQPGSHLQQWQEWRPQQGMPPPAHSVAQQWQHGQVLQPLQYHPHNPPQRQMSHQQQYSQQPTQPYPAHHAAPRPAGPSMLQLPQNSFHTPQRPARHQQQQEAAYSCSPHLQQPEVMPPGPSPLHASRGAAVQHAQPAASNQQAHQGPAQPWAVGSSGPIAAAPALQQGGPQQERISDSWSAGSADTGQDGSAGRKRGAEPLHAKAAAAPRSKSAKCRPSSTERKEGLRKAKGAAITNVLYGDSDDDFQ